MNNNINKELFQRLKAYIAISNFEGKELMNNNLSNKEKRRNVFMNKKIIATACASFVLVSGIVFASNMVNKNKEDRGLGEGIETAIENGYIAKPDVEITNIENTDINVKIEDFLMDDTNLSINFILDFDENIKNTIDIQDISHIELTDLIIRDEENRIIYSSPNPEAFKKYCTENNLDYTFGKFNENYMNTGLNSYIDSRIDNSVKLTFNIYTDSFPKSKKLYLSFETITIIKRETTQMEGNQYSVKEYKYNLTGKWDTQLDIPEEMYGRTEDNYKVISCDNADFEVYTAKATNTGFELGVIISNIEEPEYDERKMKEYENIKDAYENGEINYEEYRESKEWYDEYSNLNKPITAVSKNIRDNSYVENEKGARSTTTLSVSRRAKGYFIEGNKYDFYETFSMPKYTATDKLKVVLYYYGEPVTIELEKIK